MSIYGPTAGGTGWDLSLLGLHLAAPTDPVKPSDEVIRLVNTPVGQQVFDDLADKWSEAHVAAGAPRDEADPTARHAAEANRQLWTSE